MKRILIALLLVMCSCANAQTFYKVTGKNVNVRQGPGANYGVLTYYSYEGEEAWQLSANNYAYGCVRYLGKKQNGFMYVEAFMPSGGTASDELERGWVSAQYLKPASKCTICNGKGFFNRPSRAYNEPYCPLHQDKCYGKEHCNKCYGWGYL